MKNIANYLTVIVICVFVTAMYTIYFEKPWLVYSNTPFEVLVKNVLPGDVVPIRVARCSSSSIRRMYRFSHALVSNDRPTDLPKPLPESIGFIDPGCTDAPSTVNTIPPDTPPGKYHLIGLSEINMAVGTVLVEWYSQPFEVIK